MSELNEPKEPLKDGLRTVSPAQWTVISLAVAFAISAALYKVFHRLPIGGSSAMFIGIPAVLAIVLALTTKARTVTGSIMMGVTLGLLIVAPLVGEGYLCILMASPLFYLVGLGVGLAVDAVRRRRRTTLSCVTLLLLPMCLEGVVPELTLNRSQTVEATSEVAGSEQEVTAALAQSPRIGVTLPMFLRAGFPRPLEAYGRGLNVGDRRTIHFSGAEGDPPGDLVMRIAESRPGYVRFETVSDSSKLTQWIHWDSSEIAWRAKDATHTTVTWRIHFERNLDPAWYFVPWERAAVRDAARYLIAANGTPVKDRR